MGIPLWKQYVLARAYGDFFQDVRLERSRWRLTAAKEPVVVPTNLSEFSLSLSLTEEKGEISHEVLYSNPGLGPFDKNLIARRVTRGRSILLQGRLHFISAR